MRYDTLIIGAGLSGLAAGIRLAYYDRRVCILERHTTIGGLNSFYRLRGRDYDVGLHAVTNYAPPGTKTGPLSKLLRQLRLTWDDFGLVPQCGSSIVFPGCTLRFNNKFESFQQQIVEAFPRQADHFRRLVRRINEHDALSFDRRPLSARAVLEAYLSDPLLIEMLLCPVMFYGSPTPDDLDFSQFVILFQALYQQGFGRPREGVRPILKALVRKYKALGGELRLRSGVERIRIENGRAVGVVLDDGTELQARNVLSSAGRFETLRLCGTAPEPDGPVRPGQISFVETIFSLDRQPADLGHHETIVFYNDSETFRYAPPGEPVDVHSGIICSPNNFQYEEPLSEGRIRITALARPDAWMSLPEGEYVRAKESWCERIVASALQHIPDFRPHVLETDMFTPRTIVKYTGHANGAVYGAPEKAIDGRTPYEDLYLCGTDQGFLGIVGAMLSGISMANAYLLE
ncbi:MAG TPA: NAD(P)/FAD-dependent oxidoreductase [Planctomycetaceae bacterium]|nr:NAD(P)/FAD-dependent oxidoreductase [Planctomycetaceae bacterium]